MDVTSLQQSCLQQIAKDIDFWCPSTADNFNGYLYVLGPFDHLGPRQSQELITILAQKKDLKASHLHSLLHCGITFLDLSPCKYLVSDAVIQMVTKRCTKLCHLSLANCSRISARMLQELPKNLPNLQSLDLSGCSSCDDKVLINLSEHCNNLQVLKLESCKKVTDRGLAALDNNPGIVEMNLSATCITPQGVYLLLQNHPHMQSLSLSMCKTTDLPHVTEMVEFFSDSFLSLGATRLKYLDLSYSSANDSSIAVVSRICPEISSLFITGCEFNGFFFHLKSMENLIHLKLDGMNIDTFDSTALYVFLEERGSQLQTLYFQVSTHVDTGIIARFCPNLTHLSLAGSEEVTGSTTPYRFTLLQACPRLKVLDFHYSSFSYSKTLREHFSAIFGSALSSLEELGLANVDLASDNFVQVLESPCLSNLRIFDISSNRLVDKDLVLKIVQCCKRLQHLNVTNCWNMKLCDTEEVRQFIAQLGRQTEVIWS